jgi:sulfopyruvate decarboxylase TPP-binding subunit|tara:strand:+ start:37 stop:525 length:489 start_codon:yes stop_codon:yes gene_type:complete
LKEKSQRKIFDFLLKNKIQDFIGVPDSTLKYFIDQGLKKKKVIISTREEEAIGIAAGISLSKNLSLVFMQNAGFANCISTITSLIQLYQIPIIFLIGWRGYLKNDAPEHEKIGKIQPDLLKIINLKSKILTENNWKKTCQWAIKKLKHNQPCALIIRREFFD